MKKYKLHIEWDGAEIGPIDGMFGDGNGLPEDAIVYSAEEVELLSHNLAVALRHIPDLQNYRHFEMGFTFNVAGWLADRENQEKMRADTLREKALSKLTDEDKQALGL